MAWDRCQQLSLAALLVLNLFLFIEIKLVQHRRPEPAVETTHMALDLEAAEISPAEALTPAALPLSSAAPLPILSSRPAARLPVLSSRPARPSAIGDIPLARAGDPPEKTRTTVSEIMLRRYGPVQLANNDLKKLLDKPRDKLYPVPSHPDKWKVNMDKLIASFQPVLKDRAHIPNPAPGSPSYGDITLVSGVFDLGRGNLDASDNTQFHRKFDVYEESFRRFLTHTGPKVVFLQKAVMEKLKPHFDAKTFWVPWTLSDFHRTIGGEHVFERMQYIRTHPEWFTLTGKNGWLSKSPQATLPYYNPLVMSKNAMLAIAAELNPFNTTNMLFMDGGHQCMNPPQWTEKNLQQIIYPHMRNRFLVTYYWYGPSGECHGFKWNELQGYLGEKIPHARMKVVRGGLLGGPRWLVDLVDQLFLQTTNQTIMEGLLGTEETLLSILLRRFPVLFGPFSNDDACKENLDMDGDHACKNPGPNGKHYTNRAGNCAMFDWVYDGPPPRDKWDYLDQQQSS
eukprot:gb/GEZN01006213.1/.p1 GENE.gb/GEZN01006213.1/~~gb/GEZN01006213.1/.p1  ORF type:complete len:536 (+),score=48.42 gb/GEZN01006213.1/:79-1608(+)